MVWFFERAPHVLELETRYDNATHEYVIELRRTDAAPEIERVADMATFRSRLQTIETQLSGQQWRQQGEPVILPDGWPDVRPDR